MLLVIYTHAIKVHVFNYFRRALGLTMKVFNNYSAFSNFDSRFFKLTHVQYAIEFAVCACTLLSAISMLMLIVEMINV